jgi:hypothetical protein
MGYAGFSLKEISRSLRRADGSVGMAPVFFEGRGTELFMRKLSSFSDFMKWFVAILPHPQQLFEQRLDHQRVVQVAA